MTDFLTHPLQIVLLPSLQTILTILSKLFSSIFSNRLPIIFLPMQYLYADISVSPYSEMACDVLCAMLGEIGFDSFEMTSTGVKAYIPQDQFDDTSFNTTLDAITLPDVTFTHTIHHLENKDWNAEWEQNGFDPVLEREFGIKLNPRMAFGSGAHETTHQLVALLFQQDFSKQRVLDMGTGTGVLAIAMAMQGAQEVVAIDIDEFSVENARENIALNQLNTIQVKLGDASAIEGLFDTIVANIHKNILTEDMPVYVQHLMLGGKLIISGFFTTDVPYMEEVASQNGLSVARVIAQNDWAVMILTKNIQ